MSKQNVEIAERALDAYNRRDLDGLLESATEDYVMLPAVAGGIEGESVRGREGMERQFREVEDTWEEFRVVTDEFRDLGDRVLMLGRAQGRGRGSSVPVDAQVGFVVDFRGGKLSRVRSFLDHGEALRAAELSE
jgi:ketosteroid isomerase-like protein